MKFRIIVKDEGSEWHEDYDVPGVETIEDAQKWAENTIARFNSGLRPYETAREVVRVEETSGEAKISNIKSEHQWHKTNLVTIAGKYFGSHDTAKCENCGITGKRFGVGDVKLDREFSAKGYASCAQAIILLERRRKKREKKDEAK